MHPSISNISHQVVPTSLAFKQTSTVQTCTKLSNELPGQIGPKLWSLWPRGINLYTAWDQTKWSSLELVPSTVFMSHVFISRNLRTCCFFSRYVAPSFSRERPKSHFQNKHKGFNKLQPNPGSFTGSQEISFCYFSLAGRFRDCQALQA